MENLILSESFNNVQLLMSPATLLLTDGKQAFVPVVRKVKYTNVHRDFKIEDYRHDALLAVMPTCFIVFVSSNVLFLLQLSMNYLHYSDCPK